MKKNKLILSIIIGVVVIGALWVGSWFLIDCCIKDSTNRGEFGDKFGAINSLFSGLAFLGLIVTLLFQKEELELQRQELADTRKELEGQKKEFEEQNKIMRRQSFENTLFSMISLQQEIVNKLSFSGIKTTTEYFKSFYEGNEKQEKVELIGRSVFGGLYNTLDVTYLGLNGERKKFNGIKSAFKRIPCENFPLIKETTLFDHYFRHLYRIFKYIKESKLIDDNEDVRYDYSCIVRSQLSDYELVMLFYNCISINGKEKFKPLIEDFAVFNNLRTELLVSSGDVDLYNKSAYDRRYKKSV